MLSENLMYVDIQCLEEALMIIKKKDILSFVLEIKKKCRSYYLKKKKTYCYIYAKKFEF